ncbi:multidrug efflux SMR transporter [Marinobacteraceae bacterium S3BR75-40.1]
MNFVFLTLAIVAEVVATSALKSSAGFTRLWPSVVVVCGYGFSFFMLSLALRSIPMGVAYALWAGLGIVLIALVGVFFYNEKLDLPAIAGFTLIISGVLVLNLFSRTAGH